MYYKIFYIEHYPNHPFFISEGYKSGNQLLNLNEVIDFINIYKKDDELKNNILKYTLRQRIHFNKEIPKDQYIDDLLFDMKYEENSVRKHISFYYNMNKIIDITIGK